MLEWKAQTLTRRPKQEYEVLCGSEITKRETLFPLDIQKRPRDNIITWLTNSKAQVLQHGLGC